MNGLALLCTARPFAIGHQPKELERKIHLIVVWFNLKVVTFRLYCFNRSVSVHGLYNLSIVSHLAFPFLVLAKFYLRLHFLAFVDILLLGHPDTEQ